ncbi:MAG TPA: PDZ domain-containing protein [Gemmatimonadaceae bacterium]|nr:PDZ domain-containing protein [Gemmatimonadaceae bacterium]
MEMLPACAARLLTAGLISLSGFPAILAAQSPPSVPEPPAGWLGVTISDNALVDENFNAFFEAYPVVSRVDQRSPAAKAGVKRGDVLLSFNSHDMRGGAVQMKNWLKPGAPFTLQLRRNDVMREVRGIVGKRPEGWEEVAIVTVTPRQEIESRVGTIGGVPLKPSRVTVRRQMPSPEPLPQVLAPAMGYGGGVYPFAGAEFTALNDDLCEALGVKPEGVFVTNVMDGSAARVAGLRGGDIILKADGMKTNTPFDLVGAIRNADMRSTTSHSIELQILRKHKPQTLTLRW